ncbi:hypothetical protein KGQ19_48840, partial [Catenulispora sp. NL8]
MDVKKQPSHGRILTSMKINTRSGGSDRHILDTNRPAQQATTILAAIRTRQPGMPTIGAAALPTPRLAADLAGSPVPNHWVLPFFRLVFGSFPSVASAGLR